MINFPLLVIGAAAIAAAIIFATLRKRFCSPQLKAEYARRARLAADPLKKKYADAIERGEAWSDEQIAYDIDGRIFACCPHLQPTEQAMRESGVYLKKVGGPNVDAASALDKEIWAKIFALPDSVRYLEFDNYERSHEDPKRAVVRCEACNSRIEVVHPEEATATTPVFPAGEKR